MKKIIVIVFSICSYVCSAQNFERETEDIKVEKKGFYNVLVTPAISSQLNTDFSDIRICDAKGTETPYILTKEKLNSERVLKNYAIIENTSEKNCCTHLVLQNSAKIKIDNILLVIKHADVHRKAKLSGSNDKKTWYTIKEDYEFESIYGNGEVAEVKIVNFPMVDYEFYKLDIADSNNAPLNILSAGYYDYYSEQGKCTTLPSPVITQKDSAKKTLVTISFAAPQFIDKLSLKINGPVYYKRDVVVLTPGKKNKELQQLAIIQSDRPVELFFASLKTKTIYLEIDNKDNPPLQIQQVQALQYNIYLTAFLNSGTYKLKFEDKKASLPSYDLSYFKDSIPSVLPVITPGKDSIIAQQAGVQEDFFKSMGWIWAAIACVIVVLGYMSVKMVREMNNKG